jgi:8-oxo-dGTP pyrophosphatase MutT (NUDIX family)
MVTTDRWIICNAGHAHWGALGGAGILFHYAPQQGPPRYLLQERAGSVDFGRTWGIPGGAIQSGEPPESAARREVAEEIGVLPQYKLARTEVQECGGGWKFYMFIADVDQPFTAYCAKQTDATGWFTTEEMRSLNLHPGFRQWLEQHESRES